MAVRLGLATGKDVMLRIRKRWWAALGAGAIAIALGAVAVPALADDSTGTVAGHFLDGGQPVSSNIFMFSAEGTGFFSSAHTDADGAYEINEVPPGHYHVLFQVDSGLSQYAFGTHDSEQA